MRKGTENFKMIIEDHLNKIAEKDELFAKTLKKQNKSLDECINYIGSEVQKKGVCAVADEEVFAMAVHYYDEDHIKAKKTVSMNVVSNHMPELTDQEKAELKDQAKKEVLEAEKAKMYGKKEVKPKAVKKESVNKQPQPSLF